MEKHRDHCIIGIELLLLSFRFFLYADPQPSVSGAMSGATLAGVLATLLGNAAPFYLMASHQQCQWPLTATIYRYAYVVAVGACSWPDYWP